MGEIIISTKDLHKSFKKKEVLKGLNLNVNKGSIYGFLGKNGAGKTTTIKCLLGLFRRTAGNSYILGYDSRDLPEEAKARIGYIPQENDLVEWMKVSQLIRYTKIFYDRWDDAITEKLLKRFEIPEGAIVGELSTGQAQRLAVVLTLSFNPDVLILDEPVASLDPEGRRNFLETILDIAKDGSRTILLSSHITSDLERIADTIGILKDGIVQVERPIEDLRDSVKRLRIVPRSGEIPEGINIPSLLDMKKEPNFIMATVQNYSEDVKHTLERNYKVNIDVFDLNLEDIFLSYHSNS
ncbi:ABC transporter ATP-binding protein [bacterium]|nr:ABC transporter ATP-binding protein [bacterium]